MTLLRDKRGIIEASDIWMVYGIFNDISPRCGWTWIFPEATTHMGLILLCRHFWSISSGTIAQTCGKWHPCDCTMTGKSVILRVSLNWICVEARWGSRHWVTFPEVFGFYSIDQNIDVLCHSWMFSYLYKVNLSTSNFKLVIPFCIIKTNICKQLHRMSSLSNVWETLCPFYMKVH